MQRTDELLSEENGKVAETTAPSAGLRAVGVTNAGIQQDIDTFAPVEPAGELAGAGAGAAAGGIEAGAAPATPSPTPGT